MHRPLLEHSENTGESLFDRAEKDGLFFRNLFDRNVQQNGLLKKLCQSHDQDSKLKKLKERYEASKEVLRDAFAVIDQLVQFLALIKEEKWEAIADNLNRNDTRHLMISALYSLPDVNKISRALENSRVVNFLDADILTFFAIKDPVIAYNIIYQSFWQWIGFSIWQFFWPEKNAELPADRLKGTHVRQIIEHYPEFWEGPVNKHSDLRKRLTSDDIQALSESASEKVRKATSKAVLGDKKLRIFLEETPKSQQAANARVNLLRDSGNQFLNETKKNKLTRIVGKILDLNQNDKIRANDSTLENFYYQQFLSLIQNEKGKKVRNGHIALRDTIVRLWSNKKTSDFPNEERQLLMKRAMIRVLRLSPENTILKNMSDEFYHDLFSDPVILRNFLEKPSLLEAFTRKEFLGTSMSKWRDKLFHWVLQHVRETREGFSAYDFSSKHLLAVIQLFDVPQGELLNRSDVCIELIDVLLHHQDPADLISIIVENESFRKEKNIIRLLQKAKPMQLVEILSRHVGIQMNIKSKIAELESSIKKIEAESSLHLNKKRKSSGLNRKNNSASAIQAFKKEKSYYEALLEFYSTSVHVIQEKKELLNKLGASEVSTATVNPHEQILLNASSNPPQRQQIWESPELQRELAEKAGLSTVLLFIRSSECNKETLAHWKTAFIKLEEPENAQLLERDWHYLLNNVPHFASWILYRLANSETFTLDKEKIQSLLEYSVSGYDVLKVLEKEHQSQSPEKPLRERLLKDPAILSRVLQCHRTTLDQQLWANLIVRLLHCEKESNIAQHLRDNFEKDIVHYADYTHLQLCLHCGDTASEASRMADLREALISSQRVREELNKEPELKLLGLLLTSSSDSELMASLIANNHGFECVLKDAQLRDRCLKINNIELNEHLAIYLKKCEVDLDDARSLSQRDLFRQLTPGIIENLHRPQNAATHCQLLSILIAEVRANSSKRTQVLSYLQSTYFSRNVHSAECQELFRLFIECCDQRAVRTIFFQHPILSDSLMAKCWLSLSVGELVSMMTHEFESFELGIQDVSRNKESSSVKFTSAMIKSLLCCLPSEQYSQKLKDFLKNKAFLTVLLSDITLPQLKQILSQDKEITGAILDYFNNNPIAFSKALQRSASMKDFSHLRQLQQLLSSQSGIAALFVNHVRKDYAENCTAWFDNHVIEYVKNSSDHNAVFDILECCYRVSGGDFFLNFSVPLCDSKTRIFLFYHLCGGEEISGLYNDQIDLLREFSERISGSDNSKDFLTQLEREDLAGYDLKFSDLISEDYLAENVSDASYSFSRTEAILYTLYAFVRHLCLIYYRLMNPDDKLSKKLRIDPSFYELFSRMVGAEDRCFKQITSHCNAQQLARLIDADAKLSDQFHPFLDWLLSPEPENAALVEKIKSDSEATKILLSTQTMANLKANNNDLFQKIASLFSEKNSSKVLKTLAGEREKLHSNNQSTESLGVEERRLQDLILPF